MPRQTKTGRKAPISPTAILKLALTAGAKDPRIVRPRDVSTGHWVRLKCQFGCGGYGSSLVCPPHTPTPAQTRAMLDEYRQAVLFEAPRGGAKEIAVKLERELFLSGFYKALGLGSGPCGLCEACTFDEGCRHPDQARPSMEACGIDVYDTVRKHGYTIHVVRARSDPQHYFGLVLVD